VFRQPIFNVHGRCYPVDQMEWRGPDTIDNITIHVNGIMKVIWQTDSDQDPEFYQEIDRNITGIAILEADLHKDGNVILTADLNREGTLTLFETDAELQNKSRKECVS